MPANLYFYNKNNKNEKLFSLNKPINPLSAIGVNIFDGKFHLLSVLDP